MRIPKGIADTCRKGLDKVEDEPFFRPLGGGVEFGEYAIDALRREIREELNVEFERPRRIGVLENVFTYQGQPSHEIVFVFDALLTDERLYETESIPFYEPGIWDGPAQWIDIDNPLSCSLYPAGLLELLRSGFKQEPLNPE